MPGISAIGDVITMGGPHYQLAHVSSMEGIVLAERGERHAMIPGRCLEARPDVLQERAPRVEHVGEVLKAALPDSAVRLLAHIIAAEWLWLSRLTGTPPKMAVHLSRVCRASSWK